MADLDEETRDEFMGVIFQIEKIETERYYKTPLGGVRIDIVTTINNQELFIEPFFTNQIDEIRRLLCPWVHLCFFDYSIKTSLALTI